MYISLDDKFGKKETKTKVKNCILEELNKVHISVEIDKLTAEIEKLNSEIKEITNSISEFNKRINDAESKNEDFKALNYFMAISILKTERNSLESKLTSIKALKETKELKLTLIKQFEILDNA